jgi:hypothetical protein
MTIVMGAFHAHSQPDAWRSAPGDGASLNFSVRCSGNGQRGKAEPGQAATLR